MKHARKTRDLDHSGASLSTCERFRYSLWRQWDHLKPALTFVMLNPSTADATTDDATIRRCIGFAMRIGFGGLHVVNLYALRATDPRQLEIGQRGPLGVTTDPVGPENDRFVARAVQSAHTIVCAWGSIAARPSSIHARIAKLRNAAWRQSPQPKPLHCLRLTTNGDPAHPLRLPYPAELTLPAWPAGQGAAFGICGRCKHLLYGPIETRHHGHCGKCDALIFGNPAACHECGDSKLPSDGGRRHG